MTSLPLHALIQVIEHLPTPVVVLDQDGFIVGASSTAGFLLGDGYEPDALEPTHLRTHLGGMVIAPRTTPATPMVCDGETHTLVGLSDRFARLEVPADVATLAGEVAHDFNNLLGVIINFASLAASELPSGSPGERDLREVITASKRGAAITQRLLDVGQAGHDDHRNNGSGVTPNRVPERDSAASA
ncbi:MAG: hypothetical protein AAGC46_16025 [Solirubrobacteraceae bacterium]|nr:hypothetical protein [Patulibacter sp.]